jgi:carbon monoxide dehydrogenase subunit G
MKITYSGTTPGSAAELWEWLCEGDAALAAIPGGTFNRDGSQVTGSLRIKPGSSQITYRIAAGAAPGTANERIATLAVTGKEARGGGTIAATVAVSVSEVSDGAELSADADVEVTGRAADAEPEGWEKLFALVGGAVLSAYAVPMPATPMAEVASAPVEAAPAAVAPTPAPVADPTPALNPTPAMSHQAPTATSRPLRGPVIAAAVVVVLWLLRRRRATRR